MNKEFKHISFNSTDCISEKTMFDYIDNKLSPKEQHIVEKHMLDCELCSDACDGLRSLKDRQRIKILDELVKKRIEEKTKVIGINYRVIISVAAGLILLIGGMFFFQFYQGTMMEKKNMANLTVSEKTEPILKESAPLKDSSNISTLAKEENEAEKDEEKTRSKIEDKEADIQSEIKVTDNAAGAGASVSSGESSPAQKSILPDEDLKNVAEPKTSLDQTITLEQSASQNNIYKSDESKDKGVAADAEDLNKEGYAKEQVLSKSAEKKSALKEENKKENKREEAKPAAEAGGKVAYAPTEAAEKNNVTSTRGATGNASNDLEYVLSDSSANLNEAEQVLSVAEVMPEYPGGADEMKKFLKNNYKYSKPSENKELQNSKIIVQFIVDKNGIIKDPKIIKGINPEADKEALRVVKLMPAWKPGKQNGKKAEVLFRISIQP